MIVRTLDAKRDQFHPKEEDEEVLEPKVPYLNAIGALLHLSQYTSNALHTNTRQMLTTSCVNLRVQWI